MKKGLFFFFVFICGIFSCYSMHPFYRIKRGIETTLSTNAKILAPAPNELRLFPKQKHYYALITNGIEKTKNYFGAKLIGIYQPVPNLMRINKGVFKSNNVQPYLTISFFIFQLILLSVGFGIILFRYKPKKEVENEKEQTNVHPMTDYPLHSFKHYQIGKNPNPDQQLKELYNQALEYMKEDKPFLNTGFSREKAAADLGTNRQYLTKAIRICSNMTFGDFVFYFRLEYAKDLLLNNSKMTIECVSIESGFNTLSTFYRRFKKQYGMSPAMFRTFISTNKDKNGLDEWLQENGFFKKETDASQVPETKTCKRRTRFGQATKRVLKKVKFL